MREQAIASTTACGYNLMYSIYSIRRPTRLNTIICRDCRESLSTALLIDKSGSWINYGDVRLGQGRENAKQYLRDNPALVEEITRKVLEKRGLVGAPPKNEDNSETPEAKSEVGRKESANRRQPAAAE